MKRLPSVLTLTIGLSLSVAVSWSQTGDLPDIPTTVANTGNLQVTMDVRGNFALGSIVFEGIYGRSQQVVDQLTGERVRGLVYPRGSVVRYQIQSNTLFGGIVGNDTLVSHSLWEMFPDPAPLGNFTFKSRIPSSFRFAPDAVSDLDIISRFTDTFTTSSPAPWQDVRQHEPLGIEVIQRVYSWVGSTSDDFIIIDYEIRNILGKDIREMVVGLYGLGNSQGQTSVIDSTLIKGDDYVGMLYVSPDSLRCGFPDSVNTVYLTDNDGDPVGGNWYRGSARSALGFRVLRVPGGNNNFTFNWWALDYNPRLTPQNTDRYATNIFPFTAFSSNDASAYYYMNNGEKDFDQMFTWVWQSQLGYELPPERSIAEFIARGAQPYFMLAAGPFDLRPSEVKHVTFAWLGAEDVHTDPTLYNRTYSVRQPTVYKDNLNWRTFANHSSQAARVFDNPGVDTDGDGFRGPFFVCDDDTVYTAGDGIPDLRTEGPPAVPPIRLIPEEGKITVRWNGFFAETSPDPLTGLIDFEGYRVHLALDNRPSSYGVLSSWDIENYNRFRFESGPRGDVRWVREGIPVSLDSLRLEFNDPMFDPQRFTRSNPLVIDGESYYFAPQDFNASDLNRANGIRKVYPDAPFPGTDPNRWSANDVIYDYGDPVPRFWEYEFIIDSLLPSIPYYIGVSTFDFGSPDGEILSLETRPSDNAVMEFALPGSDDVLAEELDVFVYPNPYRADGGYAEGGYENRDLSQAPDRSKRIWFANLPPVCRISIYSLDGDRIDEIDHNFPTGGPGSQATSWDLINRNRQLIASGVYYWVVESPGRTQTGKFVVIR